MKSIQMIKCITALSDCGFIDMLDLEDFDTVTLENAICELEKIHAILSKLSEKEYSINKFRQSCSDDCASCLLEYRAKCLKWELNYYLYGRPVKQFTAKYFKFDEQYIVLVGMILQLLKENLSRRKDEEC